MDELSVRVVLKGESLKKYLAVKESVLINSDAETVRYLIGFAYRVIIEKQNITYTQGSDS